MSKSNKCEKPKSKPHKLSKTRSGRINSKKSKSKSFEGGKKIRKSRCDARYGNRQVQSWPSVSKKRQYEKSKNRTSKGGNRSYSARSLKSKMRNKGNSGKGRFDKPKTKISDEKTFQLATQKAGKDKRIKVNAAARKGALDNQKIKKARIPISKTVEVRRNKYDAKEANARTDKAVAQNTGLETGREELNEMLKEKAELVAGAATAGLEKRVAMLENQIKTLVERSYMRPPSTSKLFGTGFSTIDSPVCACQSYRSKSNVQTDQSAFFGKLEASRSNMSYTTRTPEKIRTSFGDNQSDKHSDMCDTSKVPSTSESVINCGPKANLVSDCLKRSVYVAVMSQLPWKVVQDVGRWSVSSNCSLKSVLHTIDHATINELFQS